MEKDPAVRPARSRHVANNRVCSLGRESGAAVGIDRDPDGGTERPARDSLIAARSHQQAIMTGGLAIDLKIDVPALVDLRHDLTADGTWRARIHEPKSLRPYEQIDRVIGRRAGKRLARHLHLRVAQRDHGSGGGNIDEAAAQTIAVADKRGHETIAWPAIDVAR